MTRFSNSSLSSYFAAAIVMWSTGMLVAVLATPAAAVIGA